MVGFRFNGKMVRITLPMPDPDDAAFRLTPSRKSRRKDSEATKAWEQAVKARWRALGLNHQGQTGSYRNGHYQL